MLLSTRLNQIREYFTTLGVPKVCAIFTGFSFLVSSALIVASNIDSNIDIMAKLRAAGIIGGIITFTSLVITVLIFGFEYIRTNEAENSRLTLHQRHHRLDALTNYFYAILNNSISSRRSSDQQIQPIYSDGSTAVFIPCRDGAEASSLLTAPVGSTSIPVALRPYVINSSGSYTFTSNIGAARPPN